MTVLTGAELEAYQLKHKHASEEYMATLRKYLPAIGVLAQIESEDEAALRTELSAAQADRPEFEQAIQAGDGTLHRAIDHWQERALKAESLLAAQAEPVAWLVGKKQWVYFDKTRAADEAKFSGEPAQPLYTTPPSPIGGEVTEAAITSPEDYPHIAQPASQAVMQQALDAFPLRGVLASELICWHRLTEIEAENLLAFVRHRMLKPQAAQPAERNFCERCGKRLGDSEYIHTCTLPADQFVDANKMMQPAEPLSDEQIAAIVREAARGAATRRDGTTSTRIARAIEAAHGVKSKEA